MVPDVHACLPSNWTELVPLTFYQQPFLLLQEKFTAPY
jgi:hypothetical protein